MFFDPFDPPKEIIEKAAQTIQSGGIVLHPSDTVYGLACNPFSQKALHRLLQIKGRPGGKGFLVIVHDLKMIKDLSDNFNEVFYELIDKLWPGPVTFLLNGKKTLPDAILGKKGQVGIRCPALPFLNLWSREISGPIISTSANLSGKALPKSIKQLKCLFGKQVDLFLEGEEVNQRTKPSTVIDLTTFPPRIVREGQKLREIKEILEK